MFVSTPMHIGQLVEELWRGFNSTIQTFCYCNTIQALSMLVIVLISLERERELEPA